MRSTDDENTMWSKIHEVDSKVKVLEVKCADMNDNIKVLTTSQSNLAGTITELSTHFRIFLDKFSEHLDRTEKNIEVLDKNLDKSIAFQNQMIAGWKIASVVGTILVVVVGAIWTLATHYGVF